MGKTNVHTLHTYISNVYKYVYIFIISMYIFCCFCCVKQRKKSKNGLGSLYI